MPIGATTGKPSTPKTTTEPAGKTATPPKPTEADKALEAVGWGLPAGGGAWGLKVTHTVNGKLESQATARGGQTTKVAKDSAVREVMQDVKLPKPIVLRASADWKDYTAHLSIPLSSLDTRPLSRDEFAKQLKGAIALPPWGPDDLKPAAVTIKNGRVEIDAPVLAPGAWKQEPPLLWLQLSNGQNIAVRPVNAKIGRDDTAPLIAGLESCIAGNEKAMGYNARDQAALEQQEPSHANRKLISELAANQKRMSLENDGYRARIETLKAGKEAGQVQFAPTTYPK